MPHLNTESSVHLGLAFVILPNNTELDNTLGNLDDLESFLVFGVGLQENLKTLGKLSERLLKLGLGGKDHRKRK